jgi:starch synthase
MKVLHISAECYPAAKAGGMGDVVGALPKYLSKIGCPAGVLIPKYHTKWIANHRFHTVYKGIVRLHNQVIPFSIQQESDNSTGFPLFVADIPGKFDRPGIYADPEGHTYGDEVSRYLCFQQAVLQWILHSPGQPGLIHCHDHHTGLVPFMLKHCPEYKDISNIPTVFTIHNGAYHGAFGWDKMYLLPFFYAESKGLLDWQNTINPLATAIKCAWRVTTVSPSYLEELKHQSNGMEGLLQHEQHKCLGVINGIDNQVWNPKTDQFIAAPWERSLADFKMVNKRVIGHRFNLDLNLPLVTFIGRLVGEKGADLLPDLIDRVLSSGIRVAIAVLGTGQQEIHHALQHLVHKFPGLFDVALEYNEGFAHQLYAGSDFLLMPSRVEPCGLNQMYAMRYGTLPIVRSVGGLRDTVPDIGEPDGSGRGIRFDHFTLDDAHFAIYRAVEFYRNTASFERVREKVTGIDFSWERSAGIYQEIYEEMIP